MFKIIGIELNIKYKKITLTRKKLYPRQQLMKASKFKHDYIVKLGLKTVLR